MQIKWLNKKNNTKLILFFNGWGMDEKIVSDLMCNDYDVLVIYDYRTFELPPLDLSKYKYKYLIAWSLGVYVCNLFFELLKDFNSFIAVNGTQKPIDDNYGIPVVAYNLTVDNFSELSCSKFMKKISPDFNLINYRSRTIEELKQELISIRDLRIEKYLTFTKVILSEKDRIFPIKNMVNYWNETSTHVIKINSAHYLFDYYKNWSDLL